MVHDQPEWRVCRKCRKPFPWRAPGDRCRCCPAGNPVTAEIAAREPEGTPAPPRSNNPCPTCKGLHVAYDWESACPTCRCISIAPPRPGTIRTKVSCAICHDVFTDDIPPGRWYVCEGCDAKLRADPNAVLGRDAGQRQILDLPAIDQCIRVTKLEADDVLVLRLPRDATAATIEAITAKLAASKIRCLVINPDIDVEVLRPAPKQELAHGTPQ